MNETFEDSVLCAGCRADLQGTAIAEVVQNPVYKLGELSYIELAHRACRPEWSVNDDWSEDKAFNEVLEEGRELDILWEEFVDSTLERMGR